MGKKKIYVEDVQPLIDSHNGNIAAIARELNCSRGTVWNRIQESVNLQQALENARQTMVDKVESRLYEEALAGNMTAMIFFLKTQGKSRGYTERQEITGADGSDVVLKVIYGDDGIDDTAE